METLILPGESGEESGVACRGDGGENQGESDSKHFVLLEALGP